MRNEETLPKIGWPLWQWVFNRYGLTASTILGLVSYFATPFDSIQPRIWVGVGVGIVMSSMGVSALVYSGRVARTTYLRCRYYPEVRTLALRQRTELDEAAQRLSEIVPFWADFEIVRVLYDFDSHDMHIVIAQHQEAELREGDILRVMGREDGVVMGEFTVARIRTEDYFARETEVDPVWKGRVFQEGRSEMYPPPNATVKLVQRGSQ